MRNMAFAKTISQMRDRTKTVTRRVGTWKNLESGTLLCAVEKAQGLAKGEKVKRIGTIRVLSVSQEKAVSVTSDEIAKEGFPGMSRYEFLRLLGFPSLSTYVTRIEFEHVTEER